MRLVWLVLRGGLGNQLFGLAKGLEVAAQRESVLVLDGSLVNRSTSASTLCQLSEWAIETSVPVRPFATVPSVVSASSLTSLPRKTIAALDSKATRRGQWLRLADALTLLDRHYESGETAMRVWESRVLGNLRLREPTAAHLRRISRISPHDIAVHVRLGNYRTFADGRLLLSLDYYEAAMRQLHPTPGVGVRVFSDEPEVALSMLSPLSDELGLRLQPSHPLLTPSEEMAYLSAHGRIVGSRSSFSWWAALLAGAAAEVIVPSGGPLAAPSHWTRVDTCL